MSNNTVLPMSDATAGNLPVTIHHAVIQESFLARQSLTRELRRENGPKFAKLDKRMDKIEEPLQHLEILATSAAAAIPSLREQVKSNEHSICQVALGQEDMASRLQSVESEVKTLSSAVAAAAAVAAVPVTPLAKAPLGATPSRRRRASEMEQDDGEEDEPKPTTRSKRLMEERWKRRTLATERKLVEIVQRMEDIEAENKRLRIALGDTLLNVLERPDVSARLYGTPAVPPPPSNAVACVVIPKVYMCMYCDQKYGAERDLSVHLLDQHPVSVGFNEPAVPTTTLPVASTAAPLSPIPDLPPIDSLLSVSSSSLYPMSPLSPALSF